MGEAKRKALRRARQPKLVQAIDRCYACAACETPEDKEQCPDWPAIKIKRAEAKA